MDPKSILLMETQEELIWYMVCKDICKEEGMYRQLG
jgi:hypothetical protein